MKRYNVILLSLQFFWGISFFTEAIRFGNFDSVNYYPTSCFFPSDDTDNEIRGFCVLDNGFALEDSDTSLLFDAFFQINGPIFLNGGTLNINQDLTCGVNYTIETGGIIDAHNHFLHLLTTGTLKIPVRESLESNWLDLVSSITQSANVVSSDWSFNDLYVCSALSTGTLNIYSFDGTNLALVATATTGGTVLDARWHPTEYYLAVGLDTSATADEVQIFYFNSLTNTLTLTASANPGVQVHSVAWRPDGNYLLTYRGSNPKLQMYSFTPPSTLVVGGTGAMNNTTNPHTVSWGPTGGYFVAGANTGGSFELNVCSFNGTTITSVATANFAANVRAIDWSPEGNYIAVSTDNAGTNRIELWRFTAPATLAELTTGRIDMGTAYARAVRWGGSGEYLTVGRNAGTGNEFYVYAFDGATNTFTLKRSLDVAGDVLSVNWSHSSLYIARGDTRPHVGVYYGLAINVGPLMTFIDINLLFESNLILGGPTMFYGTNLLVGRNYTLDVDLTSSISVGANSTLTLESITLNNVTANSIVLDDTSTLILSDMTMILSDDVIFQRGHLVIKGEVVITGTGSITLSSTHVTMISENSQLYFDSGLTFGYTSTVNRNLVNMADRSSVLHLYETTLYSAAPGIQFTKGTIIVEGKCPVLSDAATGTDGIWLGDGISASNNVEMRVLPESGLIVTSGYLVDKTVR